MLVSSSMMMLCPNKPPAELSDWLFESLSTNISRRALSSKTLRIRLQTSVGWVMPCENQNTEIRTQFKTLYLSVYKQVMWVMPCCENQTLDTWGLMSLTNGYKFKVRPVSVSRTGVKEASLKPRKIYLGWKDGTHNYQQRGALDAKEDDAEEIIWVVCQDVAPYGEHQRASIKQHFERSGLLKARLRHRVRWKCIFAGNMKVGRNMEEKILCRMQSLDVVVNVMLIARLLISFWKSTLSLRGKEMPR